MPVDIAFPDDPYVLTYSYAPLYCSFPFVPSVYLFLRHKGTLLYPLAQTHALTHKQLATYTNHVSDTFIILVPLFSTA